VKTAVDYKFDGDLVVLLDTPHSETRQDNDSERQQEERSLAEQQLQADQEKAKGAREHFEQILQAEIEHDRMIDGLCVFCGRPLSVVSRWLRFKNHRGCASFTK
jgi:hypothetical protein